MMTCASLPPNQQVMEDDQVRDPGHQGENPGRLKGQPPLEAGVGIIDEYFEKISAQCGRHPDQGMEGEER